MTLPKAVLNFLNNKAQEAQVAQPKADDDLFSIGILDSFDIVDFISILEEECGINVPDVDVVRTNFQSINAIENYVASRKVLLWSCFMLDSVITRRNSNFRFVL